MARRRKTTILTEFGKPSLNQGTAGGPNKVVEKQIFGISPGRMRNIAKEVVENSPSSGLNCNTVMQCPGIIGLSTAISTLQLQIITALSNQHSFVNTAPLLPRTGGPKILDTGVGAGTIYYSDGINIYTNLNLGGGGGDGGILYSLSNGTVVASTTGNRGLASTGTGADKTYETSQEIDPLTGNTISQTFGPGGTVVFDDTDINFENGTTLNYDSTVVSNHNGDTVNYDGSTINSTNTEYNHTGDTINYDATTTVDGGTFNNNTFNNPTFTGSSVIAGALVTDYIPGNIATTVYTLSNIPSGTIQVSTQGGIIQIEPSDYTHTDNTITFTGNVNRTGIDLIVTYIKGVAVTAPSLKVGPITRTPAGSSFTHTNALSTATSVVNGISVISGTVNGNYFDFDTSVAGQITFTSKDFLGNSVSENGIVFYYTVNY